MSIPNHTRANFQTLLRAAASGDRDSRTRAVADAVRAAAEEAAHAHADAVRNAITPAPRLAGAFAEAIGGRK